MSKITNLGLGIIAFEGLEHIKNIVYEIKDLVASVVVCLQSTSYMGDKIDEADVKDAEMLKDLGYIDEIIWFEPEDFHIDKGKAAPRMIETDKRNFVLDYLEFVKNCSHSLIIDSDEFYDHDDFKRAIDIINTHNDIHVTYCQYVNYYRDYRHTLIWPFLAYVPFITESKYRFSFANGSFDKPSDPTRRYYLADANSTYHIMPYEVIKMHHLSWIRLDITKKIKSWSAKKYFEDVQGLEEAILDRYYNYKEGQPAILMFNVPHYSVAVTSLNKQYIHPHYRLNQIPECIKR